MKRLFVTLLAGGWLSVSGGCGKSDDGTNATMNPAGSSGGASSTGTSGGSSVAGISNGGSGDDIGGGSGGRGAAGSAVVAGDGGMADPKKVTVVLFLIDGLQVATAKTAIANGGTNIKFIVDNGVTVDAAYASSPAARLVLPDNSLPWGNATSGNVATHTGTHLFESHQMDDIFLAGKAAGIKSVFSGGDANYVTFTNSDFHYASNMTDAETVQHAIDHLKNDGVRLIRVHLQRIRDAWTGPAGETNATSAYIRAVINADGLLGNLIQALKDVGVWNDTYVVVSSDHGMGTTSESGHVPSQESSWSNFMAFYGPGIKKGATIPYAELPDIAVTTAHLFGWPALKGHTDPAVTLMPKGPTGTLLSNIFEGAPQDIPHPHYIQKYIQQGTFATTGDGYAPYRDAMLQLVK
jgi:hypothetical protein